MILTRINTSPEHLINLMGQLNLTTDLLAEETGVHRTTAFRWVAGTAQIPISVIRMLELMIKDENND
jgi:hypothetical protein